MTKYTASGLVANAGPTGHTWGGRVVTVAGLTPNRTRPGKATVTARQKANGRRLARLERRLAALEPRLDKTLAEATVLGLIPSVGEPMAPADPRPTVVWHGTRSR